MGKYIICYQSYSGNTMELAELIQEELKEVGINADLHRIGTSPLPQLESYDFLFIGTSTWGKGESPEEIKVFARNTNYKPKKVAVFGTGDTQFGGDDLFCYAAVRLSNFYKSQYPVLKIEQSPEGQEGSVKKWIQEVLKNE